VRKARSGKYGAKPNDKSEEEALIQQHTALSTRNMKLKRRLKRRTVDFPTVYLPMMNDDDDDDVATI
jgi:hypothetical protein